MTNQILESVPVFYIHFDVTFLYKYVLSAFCLSLCYPGYVTHGDANKKRSSQQQQGVDIPRPSISFSFVLQFQRNQRNYIDVGHIYSTVVILYVFFFFFKFFLLLLNDCRKMLGITQAKMSMHIATMREVKCSLARHRPV